MAQTKWQAYRPVYDLSDDVYSTLRIGAKCRVGSDVRETGRYKHSVCPNTEFFTKGSYITACQNRGTCPHLTAEWILEAKQM